VIIQLPFRPQLTLQSTVTDENLSSPLLISLRTNKADADDIFRLRYKGYRRDGLIEACSQEIYSDKFDSLPSTFQIAAYSGVRHVGALRICFWDPTMSGDALPCEDVYPEVANIKIRENSRIAEVSRLTVDPDLQNRSFKTTVYAALVRSAVLMCMAGNVTILLAGSQPKWKAFYQRILGFSVAGEPQLYPPGNLPILLLSRKMGLSSPARSGLNPFFHINAADVDAVREKMGPLLNWGAGSERMVVGDNVM
jgi:N-acyl-L-homoserine lactone synthetase